jgi:hypothetical protein
VPSPSISIPWFISLELTPSGFSQPLRNSLNEDGVGLAHWRIRGWRRIINRGRRGGVQPRRRERGWGSHRRRVEVGGRWVHRVEGFVGVYLDVFGVLLA